MHIIFLHFLSFVFLHYVEWRPTHRNPQAPLETMDGGCVPKTWLQSMNTQVHEFTKPINQPQPNNALLCVTLCMTQRNVLFFFFSNLTSAENSMFTPPFSRRWTVGGVFMRRSNSILTG